MQGKQSSAPANSNEVRTINITIPDKWGGQKVQEVKAGTDDPSPSQEFSQFSQVVFGFGGDVLEEIARSCIWLAIPTGICSLVRIWPQTLILFFLPVTVFVVWSALVYQKMPIHVSFRYFLATVGICAGFSDLLVQLTYLVAP